MMASRPDWLTVISIALVVHTCATLIHEGAGHGGACLAAGCVPRLLTSMQFDGDESSLSVTAVKFIAAAGTLANLCAGFAAMLLLRRSRDAGGSLWFFLWLFATVNLLQATGYPLYSGIGNIGDWAAVVRGFKPVWLWRAGLAVLGGTTYFLVARSAMARLGQRLSETGPSRVAEAMRYTLVAYLSGGALSLLAGVFEPGGALIVLISGVAASLGGTSGLAWGPQLLHDPALGRGSGSKLAIRRDRRWIIGGLCCAVFFVFVLGRGIRLSHESARAGDEKFVSPFLRHAEEIFAAATGGAEDCAWSLLVGRDGAIRMVSGNEWQLEPLRLHHGAREAYRVTRAQGRVRLEARSGSKSCVLQSGEPAHLRPMLADFPQYVILG
jgi:hypothetical protein